MASIFKRSRKKNQPYTIQYVAANGNRKTVKAFTDKGESEAYASQLEQEARRIKAGLVDPVQTKLATSRHSPLEEHLVEFRASLEGRTAKHVTLTMGRVRKIVNGCNFQKLADIESELVRTWVRTFCTKKKLGNRTFNHYVQAIDSFCYWCVQSKRLIQNPLLGLKRENAEVDIKHPRRALTPEEFALLVESARSSRKSIQCFSGEQRARIYLLSYMTGLRRLELASLTRRSFTLDAAPPTVTVQAACSKHRKTDVLPLHPDLVTELRGWVAKLKPSDHLFPKLAKRRTWLMVKKDLGRVGIPYETPEGIADFHAAGRHTYITELLRNGASLPEARELARHSDIKMTMKYTHIGMDDRAKALLGLPSSALHRRCNPSVFDRQKMAGDGTTREPRNDKTPGGDRGSGMECHSLAEDDTVEAAGIEPASRDIFTKASTCVAEGLIVDQRSVTQQDFPSAYSGTC
jgi:integrase